MQTPKHTENADPDGIEQWPHVPGQAELFTHPAINTEEDQ